MQIILLADGPYKDALRAIGAGPLSIASWIIVIEVKLMIIITKTMVMARPHETIDRQLERQTLDFVLEMAVLSLRYIFIHF